MLGEAGPPDRAVAWVYSVGLWISPFVLAWIFYLSAMRDTRREYLTALALLLGLTAYFGAAAIFDYFRSIAV